MANCMREVDEKREISLLWPISAARATVHSPEVVPTDLLTCSGARPGKGIFITNTLPEVYDFDNSLPNNKSACGRGSFLLVNWLNG